MELDRRTFLAGCAASLFLPSPFRKQSEAVRVGEMEIKGVRDGDLWVYKGIPFAQPPVGKLRFQPPQPLLSLAGEKESRQAPVAVQPGQHGSEDCLYLNIWAPADPGPHPVLVWIHGGGNVSGGTAGQSGAGFAKLGIVTVIVPYRLGALGFLELGELLGSHYRGSGDCGLLDLTAALKWIQSHIKAFGGDPGQVTIAGLSAGAKDVAALVASPRTRGLFSRAISESGGGQTVHTPASAREVAVDLLTALDLRPSEASKLLDLSAEELLAGQEKMAARYPHDWPFRPNIETRFLPRRPVDLVDGRIPMLIGTCRDESLAFFSPEDADVPIRPREVANIPASRIPEMEEKYRKTFPQLLSLDRRVRLLTAEEYWMPSIRYAEAHSSRGGDTWMYRFDHASLRPGDPRRGYATHGSDNGYAWEHHDGWSMHETWADFIKGKAPNWPRYDVAERNTLIYGQDGGTTLVSDPRGDERALWTGVL